MKVEHYLAARRAYNLLRQNARAEARLSFGEFSCLIQLLFAGKDLKSSDLSQALNSARPTITHRTSRLQEDKLLRRVASKADRRNVYLRLSKKGERLAHDSLETLKSHINHSGSCLKLMVSVSSQQLSALDLILVSLLQAGTSSLSISQICDLTGYMQPTISMSCAKLLKLGLIKKNAEASGLYLLTDEGQREAQALIASIEDIAAPRK